MTIASMDIWESQYSLCLRAANWTGMEDCAHLAHFAAAFVPAAGCPSAVPADDKERPVSTDDSLPVLTGGD
jgi:hypothetical protein